ncbi:MAG: D-glycero-beta-D-manno-heptose 1-phosphate adenylyltransferase [Elusimicrobia bacterium]|nr:D-glycero-beta-D-manno-heptose 1-phosphate adenylyltransferase [Elusimicrobiota bacterium]
MVRKKLIPLKKLIVLRNRWKAQHKKVVFTNGCFDLIHAGHVSLLEKAQRLGNILVIGLNTDSSVRKLKGKNRPITPEKSRAKILSALACVDYVVLFKEETPFNLIRSLHPDILVKGADYEVNHIVGREYAGKVVRIALKKGYSTTTLIQKIKRAS